MVYADNAATTRLDPIAFEAMKPFLLDDFANPSQPYSFSRKAKQALKDAREKIARCINASPDEIYFTSGGTESDNWAIKGACDYDKLPIITSQIEHHAVLRSCEQMERIGYPVAYLPVRNDGTVMSETLERFISDRTRLVSVMLANNENGAIQNISELATIAHTHGAIVHTDAVQAVGHIPVDVKQLNVDMLSASAHKFNGPKGIGFLYSKNNLLLPFHNGGSQEYGKRAGTENVPAIVAMAVALENNYMHLNENINHLNRLTDVFLSNLNVPYRRNGNPNGSLPGLLSLSFENLNGEAIQHILDMKGFFISTGSACDAVNQRVSHVIKAMNVPDEYAKGTVRISFGKFNNEEEAKNLANTLSSVVEKMRQ